MTYFFLLLALFAFQLTIDPGMATVLVAVLVLIGQVYQLWMSSRIHTLANSNFNEAKAARLAAEGALAVSNALNAHLQQQLDARTTVQIAPTPPVAPATIPPAKIPMA